MLGVDIVAACRKMGLEPIIYDLPEFDITNPKQLEMAVSKANIIINCAAYTNVDGAESQTELAYKVNSEAVRHLGSLAKELNIWILHVSTDFVFNGQLDKPYKETDTPEPINEYGKSKLAGEKALAQSGCNYCIFRVQWTYGSGGNNFVTKLVQRAKQTNKVRVVDDQIGSPTATTETANAIIKLLKKQPQGIYHFASSGYTSRFDMARFIFDKLSMDVDLSPCKTADFNSIAKRPLNSRFDCTKLIELLGENPVSWQKPLEAFLRKL